MHKVMVKYTFDEPNWYALKSSKLQVKADFI